LQQAELRGLHAARGIATGSWSPLTPNEADDDAVARLARSNAKTTSQVVLRWQLQLGNVVTAQPLTDEGAREDIDVFDFELSHRELAAIADLGRNRQMLLR
jgi:2,5-diketo-D-gluconate reductase A